MEVTSPAGLPHLVRERPTEPCPIGVWCQVCGRTPQETTCRVPAAREENGS